MEQITIHAIATTTDGGVYLKGKTHTIYVRRVSDLSSTAGILPNTQPNGPYESDCPHAALVGEIPHVIFCRDSFLTRGKKVKKIIDQLDKIEKKIDIIMQSVAYQQNMGDFAEICGPQIHHILEAVAEARRLTKVTF